MSYEWWWWFTRSVCELTCNRFSHLIGVVIRGHSVREYFLLLLLLFSFFKRHFLLKSVIIDRLVLVVGGSCRLGQNLMPPGRRGGLRRL